MTNENRQKLKDCLKEMHTHAKDLDCSIPENAGYIKAISVIYQLVANDFTIDQIKEFMDDICIFKYLDKGYAKGVKSAYVAIECYIYALEYYEERNNKQ